MKTHVDELDEENFVVKFTIIEGDVSEDVIEKITFVIKILPSADGGSITITSSTYYTKGDAKINEEDIMSRKDKAAGVFKALEAYFDDNPDDY